MSTAASTRSVRLETLGCRVNQAESAGLEAALASRGWRTRDPDPPDVIVVNTCAVTGNADADGRKLLRRLHRRHPDASLVVTGCQAEREAAGFAELPGVRLVVGNAAKHRIPELLARLPAAPAPAPSIVPGEPAPEDGDRYPEIASAADLSEPGRTRALVKVQDGCDRSCTFCVIPGTRGASRSRAAERIVAELDRLGAAGVPEAVLTGIDLGSWGRDLEPARSLAALIRDLDRAAPVPRLRLSSLDPRDLDEQLASAVAEAGSLCPHLHVSLQTAAPAVHRRMGRGPFPGRLLEHLERIRAARPDLALGLDLMSGFPGETDDDHRATLDWVRAAPVTYLHVFPYSERPGTAAVRLGASRVAPDRVAARAAELRELGARLRTAHHQRQVGRTLEVVVERIDDGRCRGTGASFVRVGWSEPPGARSVPGDRVEVRVTDARPDGCTGVRA